MAAGNSVMNKAVIVVIMCSAALLAPWESPAQAAPQAERPPAPNTPVAIPLTLKRIKPDLYLITGRGGNSVARMTPDGIILVDNKVMRDSVYRELGELLATRLQGKPVKVAFMTHHHADHTGNNARLLESGAQLIGQRNVLETLRNYKSTIAPRNPAPPSVVFDSRHTVSLGGVTAHAYYWGPGHTNADIAVYFPDQKVLVVGDIIAADGEPDIDALDAGGSLLGLQQRLIDVLGVDFELVIPGHGDNAMTRDDVLAYQKRIDAMVSRLKLAVRRGVPQEQLIASVDVSDLAFRLVGHFWSEPARLAPIYRELAAAR